MRRILKIKAEEHQFVPIPTIKEEGGVEVQLHSYMIPAPDGGKWPNSLPGRFASAKDVL
jgi:hypothetical protein